MQVSPPTDTARDAGNHTGGDHAASHSRPAAGNRSDADRCFLLRPHRAYCSGKQQVRRLSVNGRPVAVHQSHLAADEMPGAPLVTVSSAIGLTPDDVTLLLACYLTREGR